MPGNRLPQGNHRARMSMATNDTHPAVTADSGPLPGPGLTLAPVSSLTRQPACHLPAGERDRA
jgi:hypothetical protein